MTTTSTNARTDAGGHDDRPSSVRVERFLQTIEDDRTAVIRRRWVGAGVGAAIAAVAVLTALGVVPVVAEEVVLSASAVVAGFALSKG